MAQTFYCCQGGDGTTPLVADAAHCWDADDVSTSGNWASPKVDGKVGPGDTIYFVHDGGNIKGTGVGSGAGSITIRASGDAGSPITLQGDGTAVITGEGGTPTVGVEWCIRASGKDYITIKDLELCYGFRGSINFWECDNWIVQNCNIHDATPDGSWGILIAGTGNNWLIEYCDVHDILGAHCIYFYEGTSGAPSTNVTIQYNKIYNATTTGIHINGTDYYFTGHIIRYNWFENNGYDDLNFYSTDGAECYGNIFYHSGASNDIGIYLGDEAAEGPAHVKNTKIWNNTFYGKFTVVMDLSQAHTATPCISEFKNNIILTTAGFGGGPYYWYFRATTDNADVAAMDYNLYHSDVAVKWQDEDDNIYANLAAWVAATTYDDHSVEADPLFTDAPNGDFTLGAPSPARASGVLGGPAAGLDPSMVKADFGRGGNIVLRAFGTTPAMGAYAYGSDSAWVMIYG